MKFLKLILLRIKAWISKRFPRIAHYVRLFKWRIVAPIRRTVIRKKQAVLHVDPYQVFWIPPHIMKYTIYGPEDVPSPGTVSGMVKDGDWDRNTLPVDEIDIVCGARDRFVKGMDWQETEYYRSHLDRISKGEQWRGFKNKQDLDDYCRQFDRLYYEIKNNAYKRQSVIPEAKFGNKAPVEHEITVHIDRDGRYLFCDGRHRLSIALALGIDTIPVKVCIRHAKWQVFCNEILGRVNKNGGKVYQPLTHPDLQNIPSANGEKRFEIIKEHLPKSRGTLLDIGANWGYFCHRFEEIGFECYAIEADQGNAYFMEKLRVAQDRRFKIVNQSILTYGERNSFDVVLALNIFHHFLKTEADYNTLIGFLKKMDIKTMFFEPHLTSEPQMKQAYRNYEPGEFVSFLLKFSCLNHRKLIGEAENGRPIYKLWR